MPTAENDVPHEKWREAGWTSPDEILAALTDERLRLAKVREVVAEAQEMAKRGSSQFRTGQEHLSPAFREVNWKAAFKAVAALLTKVEHAVDTRDLPPDAHHPRCSGQHETVMGETACVLSPAKDVQP